MSLNFCTDELLLDLAPPSRIASVTYLSRSPSNTFRSAQASTVEVNHGTAEEVLTAQPDLVLAGLYTTPAARALLKKAGVPLLEVPAANNFEEIRSVTRTVAQALGEVAAGEALIEKMNGTLTRLRSQATFRSVRVAGWDGSGAVPGKATLFDAILTAAGGINIAASMHGSGGGAFDLEQLLLARPDVLAYGAESAGRAGLRADTDQHPLVLKLYAHRRIVYPEVLYSCGVPESAEAAVAMRAALVAALAGE